jgi:hypothetical protein
MRGRTIGASEDRMSGSSMKASPSCSGYWDLGDA